MMPLAPGLLADLSRSLSTYQPWDELEQAHLDRFNDILATHQGAAFERGKPCHITASAVLLSSDQRQIGLIWHEKLQRWLQPGGHVEPDQDVTTDAAAWRELMEETALPASAITRLQADIFDLDVHAIPGPACAEHLDVRYLFRLVPGSWESPLVRWVAPASLIAASDASMARFARKVEARTLRLANA